MKKIIRPSKKNNQTIYVKGSSEFRMPIPSTTVYKEMHNAVHNASTTFVFWPKFLLVLIASIRMPVEIRKTPDHAVIERNSSRNISAERAMINGDEPRAIG